MRACMNLAGIDSPIQHVVIHVRCRTAGAAAVEEKHPFRPEIPRSCPSSSSQSLSSSHSASSSSCSCRVPRLLRGSRQPLGGIAQPGHSVHNTMAFFWEPVPCDECPVAGFHLPMGLPPLDVPARFNVFNRFLIARFNVFNRFLIVSLVTIAVASGDATSSWRVPNKREAQRLRYERID